MMARCRNGGWSVADSPRKKLLAAINAQLRLIATAAGYNTNLGAALLEEPRQLIADEDAAGLVAYIAGQAAATDPAVARTHRLTTVEILGRGSSNTEAMIDAITGDVEQAMDAPPVAWPHGFTRPVFVNSEPLRSPAGANWAGVVLRFTSHIPKR